MQKQIPDINHSGELREVVKVGDRSVPSEMYVQSRTNMLARDVFTSMIQPNLVDIYKQGCTSGHDVPHLS